MDKRIIRKRDVHEEQLSRGVEEKKVWGAAF
jgi:hypothetical protein